MIDIVVYSIVPAVIVAIGAWICFSLYMFWVAVKCDRGDE